MMFKPDAHKLLRDAASAINDALDWGHTPQGSDYWYKLYMTLVDMSSQAGLSSPSSLSVNNTNTLPESKFSQQKILLLHIYDGTGSLCGLKGDPKDWSGGNKFVRLADKDKATCSFCKSKAPL